jgi:hypothetical protein
LEVKISHPNKFRSLEHYDVITRILASTGTTYFPYTPNRLGIRGTHLKSSIQDIMDEVAPIKKAPLWG